MKSKMKIKIHKERQTTVKVLYLISCVIILNYLATSQFIKAKEVLVLGPLTDDNIDMSYCHTR